MRKLIVNADDFGLHTEINKGIIKGFKEGFITSTSLMCSAPAFEEAVDLAKANPDLGVGLHLTLVGGVAPILPKNEVRSLVDNQGLFVSDYVAFAKRFYTGVIDKLELEKELRAQLERALSSGISITHLDSHQHIHILPGVSSIVQRLGKEYGVLKIRIPKEGYTFSGGFSTGIGRFIGRTGLTFCAQLASVGCKSYGYAFPDHFFGMLAGGNLNRVLIANILKHLPEGTSEIMTHPGLSNYVLSRSFAWGYHWEQELAAYLDLENLNLLTKKEIKLINFGDL